MKWPKGWLDNPTERGASRMRGGILVYSSEAHSHMGGRRPPQVAPMGWLRIAHLRSKRQASQELTGGLWAQLSRARSLRPKKKCNFQIPVGPPAPESWSKHFQTVGLEAWLGTQIAWSHGAPPRGLLVSQSVKTLESQHPVCSFCQALCEFIPPRRGAGTRGKANHRYSEWTATGMGGKPIPFPY